MYRLLGMEAIQGITLKRKNSLYQAILKIIHIKVGQG